MRENDCIDIVDVLSDPTWSVEIIPRIDDDSPVAGHEKRIARKSLNTPCEIGDHTRRYERYSFVYIDSELGKLRLSRSEKLKKTNKIDVFDDYATLWILVAARSNLRTGNTLIKGVINQFSSAINNINSDVAIVGTSSNILD